MKSLAARLMPRMPVFSLIISLIVSWLALPVFSGFPFVAFFLFAVCTSSLIYFVRKEKSWLDLVLYIGIVLLSLSTLIWSNDFIQFLNFVFIIFFASLLARPVREEHGVFTILFSPFSVFLNTLWVKNIFPYRFRIPVKYAPANYIKQYMPTLIVTALVMIITIPLLASANPFFNALVQNLVHAFNLEWLSKFLFADSVEIYFLRIVFFLALLFFIPRLLTLTLEGSESKPFKAWFAIDYLFPKIAMAGLLMIFFVTQMQLYFASAETLLNMGYTNSRLTNEVFAQVTIVAFIVFLLAYFDKSRKNWNTRLTYFLIIEAFFLIGVAFKSVFDYSSLFGFTQKRLWGYTTMTWLTGAFIAFIYHYYKKTPHLRFVKQILTYTLGILLLVNVLNFDNLIASYYKPTMFGKEDYVYLAGLSADAHNFKEVYEKALKEAEETHFLDSSKIDSLYMMIGKIDSLQYKYEKRKEYNAFNYAEYKEYQAIKDLDLEKLRQKIQQTQLKYTPKETIPTTE